MAMSADDEVKIIVSNRDPIVISKQTLVKGSSVFSKIFLECGDSEHDMTDFSPEIVEKFLKLLEEKQIVEIRETEFKELHKIAVVFNVGWLINSCRHWLIYKIRNIGETIHFEPLEFLFKESYYIYSKWDLAQFLEALIFEVRFKDTSSSLLRYLRKNYDQTTKDQFKFLLYLAGSNTSTFLGVINERIQGQEYLDDRTRYLLKHMNLTLCVQQNEGMYHEMCRRISEMRELSDEDCRVLFKLTTQATREASNRQKQIPSTTAMLDFREFILLYRDCQADTFSDIIRLVSENKISSMYTVVAMLVNKNDNNILTTETIEEFVERLENLKQNKVLRKVSTLHLDMWLTALERLEESIVDNNQQLQFIQLLKKIRNSEKLSSNYDNIRLVGENISRSSVFSSLKDALRQEKLDRYLFRMKHPCVSDCKEKLGDCGFIVLNPHHELSREESDYIFSGVHLHDEIRAEDMNWYWISRRISREGAGLRVPVMLKDWWGLRWRTIWFNHKEISENDWETNSYYADYNIENHLVTKFWFSILIIPTFCCLDLFYPILKSNL